MFIIFGYRTSRNDEVPEILYFGTDAAEAARIGEEAKHPRVARLDHPIPRAIRHFDEKAAEAFELELLKSAKEMLDNSQPDDVALALGEAVEEIDSLKAKLAEAEAKIAELSKLSEAVPPAAAVPPTGQNSVNLESDPGGETSDPPPSGGDEAPSIGPSGADPVPPAGNQRGRRGKETSG